MAKPGQTFINAAVIFFVVFFILNYVFPIAEGFDVTMYGAQKYKPRGSKCQFDPECASNTCLPFSSNDGPRFTCK